jgi:peptidoglycan DL-endopeptidase CwlO
LGRARDEQQQAEEALAERAAGIYRSGGVQLLEVLLGTTSFEDFLTRMEWLRRVNRNDAVLVLNVKDAVAAVQSAERTLERRETELVTLRRQTELKSREVDEAVAQQERYVTNLDREVAELVAAEEERLRREAEERARRAAEEAARRAAAEAAALAARAPATATPSTPGTPARPNNRTFDASRLGPGRPEAVVAGMAYLGVPYVWGGSTPQGFDCSGLTWYVYREIGISIPRNSRSQFTVGAYIPPDRMDLLVAGDLVFFGSGGNADRIHHVGIYVGGGDYLHAPSTGRPVQVESLTSRIDRRGDFVGATRP